MAELDPNASFEAFKQRALEGIAQQFPVDGRDRQLVLDKLEVKDNLHPDDIRSQYRAKTEGATWSVPVYAHLTLKDKATGKALDQKSVRVAELPKMTKRYSYIVNGQEVQVDHQWQLKPGAYTRRRQSGELETRFQVGGNKPSFDITFDPASKQFRLEYGKTKSKIPLYPLVKEMGIGDDQLERLWGKEILQANQDVRNAAGAVAAFYKTTKRQMPPSDAEAHRHLVDTMRASTLRPDSTEITLGKGFEHVTGDALAHAGKRLLAVQSGEPEDDRDSVVFKDLRGTGDYAYDKLIGARFDIKSKFARRINKAETVRDVVKFEAINKPIQEAFTKNQAAQYAKQINPVEMLSSAYQTTVMGEGGIKSERQILDEVKNLNASHLGFIDPAATPEGSRTGVTLRIPMGAKIDGREPKVPLYNLKTQKIEYVGPREFISKKVVLPDQVKWEGGKPVPLQKQVKIAGKGNEIQDAKFQEADYVLRHSSQLFNPTTNLIPFLNNNSGGRATMATRHIEQAISLVDRTAPLVQVATPSAKESSSTFESLLGNHVMAHTSPVDGTVKQVKNDAIIISGGGKDHEVQLYRNYPLNDSKSVLDSTALVKPGDRVKSGQVVADTNFTKGGKLALGRDLKIAYIPYRGLNFEDAYVISEAAAQKLSSLHLHKPSLDVGGETVLGKKMFMSQRSGSFSKGQLESIGDDGLIRIGAKVNPGDPLVLALQKTPVQRNTGLAALRKSFGSQHADRSLTWEGETAGEVVAVHKSGDNITVHVRTVEPVQIGDKLSARHANKGIVSAIVPVDQMPRTKDGTPMEVLMNPLGVGGRVNPGQLLETAASKIARKTGKSYVVENFSGQDQLEKVKRELKQHGLSDTDELNDPVTGLSLGRVLTGDMHMLKLHHQVDKKIAVRSGMSLPGRPAEKYDINMQPAGGGEEGGQSMDTLGHYALLARGAKANIREMQTFKSEGPDMNQDPNKRWGSQHHAVWDAIQHGDPLPTPRPTFAFNKFTSLLKAAGVNVEKKGNEFIVTPLTDRQIKDLTGDRVLPRADLKPLYAKIDPKTGDPKPVSGSLFDEKLTGGHGGFKWSRIDLAEPLPNPLFESSIRALTGLSGHEYNAIISGEKALNHKGAVVELGKGVTGGQAIHDALARIDVPKELEGAKRELANARMDKANPLVKKVKYLQMLQDQNLKPQDAYVLHHLPVIPPVMRPISLLKDGNLRVTDINQLYNNFAEVNSQLKDPTLQRGLTEQAKKDLRKNLYDGASALMGIDKSYSDAENKGLLHQIAGKDPKSGLFQSVLIKRKQDMSMRGVVIPEPSLGLDEIGLPKQHALKLMAPFVVHQLKSSGVASSVIEAQGMVAKETPQAIRALEHVVQDRPVLVKRDPVLHKYSIQAFKPKLVEGHTVKVHPLVTSGFNMDFDGDAVSIFVPISEEARREAVGMMPSNNLFSDAHGKLVYQPTLESALGLYKLSLVDGKQKPRSFKSYGEAVEASRAGKLDITHPIQVGDQKTTVGRVLMSAALPQPMQKKILSDLQLRLDRGGLDKLLTQVAKEHKDDYGTVVNKLKNMGNGASFGVVTVEHAGYVGAERLDPQKGINIPVGAHTLSLADITPDKETRDHVLAVANKKAAEVEQKPLSRAVKNQQLIQIYSEAGDQMKERHLASHGQNPTNLLLMAQAKTKPSWDQYKQMTLAPMLVEDAMGRLSPKPITKTFAEGLDVGQYWQQMAGARRGAIMKVQEVREPGYLTKLLNASSMDTLVTGHDCGAQFGAHMYATDRETQDRYLAQDYHHKDQHLKAGTLLTPQVLASIRAGNKDALLAVRSPLRCENEKGICQKCMGLSADGHDHQIGTNVGVLAAQTLGERAVQLTLKHFHTGGAVSGGKSLVGDFTRFKQLAHMPEQIPNEAVLATADGTIEKIEPDRTGAKIWIGGKQHHVAKDEAGAPLWKPLVHNPEWHPPKVGDRVQRGALLSDPTRSIVNPRDLYAATGSIEKTKDFLADEMYRLYEGEGVKRKHVEVLVKNLTNLTQIQDPAGQEGLLRGELQPQSRIAALNRKLQAEDKPTIQHKPVLKELTVLPLSLHEDWIAKLQYSRLRNTVMDAAATGAVSNIHSNHPIPAMAFGSEFGLTSEDAKKRPSLKHLESVPSYSY